MWLMFKLIAFYKPIHDELKKLQNGWTNKRDKYEEAHRAELTLWNAASRYLHANLPKGTKTLPIAEWEQEYADLKTQRDSDYTKLKDTRAEVAELQKIRRCVDIALRADQPEQTQSRTSGTNRSDKGKDGQAVLPVRPKCFPIKWTLLIPNIKTNLLFRP